MRPIQRGSNPLSHVRRDQRAVCPFYKTWSVFSSDDLPCPSPWNGDQLLNPVERVSTQPENPFARLIPDQQICIVPAFELEAGDTLYNVPVAYTTRGRLSPNGDNALVICHALSGSADVADWWGPLMGGPGQAFDASRFFVICLNSLGSPYGTASPVTNKDSDPKHGLYGPEFPLTTIRDDVNLHKLVLDDLGVKQIAAVVGGSMGGMLCLEWAFFGKDYVRCIVPIATSARHSAWGISWGETQRQSIYSDPKYEDGYYSLDDPPASGLGAARMAALLTYRSRNSFETRFGRNTPDLSRRKTPNSEAPSSPQNHHWTVHNDGHKSTRGSRPPSASGSPGVEGFRSSLPPGGTTADPALASLLTDPQFHGSTPLSLDDLPAPKPNRVGTSHYFSAQSYLRYQGQKFIRRFDANCYIAITRKLDTHDISRHRTSTIAEALGQVEQPALVLGIESDGLFTFAEQEEIAQGIKNSRLRKIDSPEGHDAFLLQFEQVNTFVLDFFKEVLTDIMGKPGLNQDGTQALETVDEGIVGKVIKSSTFGEAEAEDMLEAW